MPTVGSDLAVRKLDREERGAFTSGGLRHPSSLELKIAGTESNMAITLSGLGISTGWVGSRAPTSARERESQEAVRDCRIQSRERSLQNP